jgi:predicted nucleic acid-binding protein
LILLDTNILLRFIDGVNPDCKVSQAAVRALRRRGEILAIAPQNLYEFWAVATRATGNYANANGLGLSSNRADLWLGYWLRNYPLLDEPADLPARWRTIVRVFNVIGKKSHDARLAAVMQFHNITRLLTFNAQDFRRFHFISVLDPRTIS